MDDQKQVHEFAIKWIHKFRDQRIGYTELVDHDLADDCKALGFQMDCGKAFEELYLDAFHSTEELDENIDAVTDIKLLGSAIYSKWRYFNHWAHDASEILLPENRAWFILALSRLAVLTSENPFVFHGDLKAIQIISNALCYGPCPEPDDEIEQHIRIFSDGNTEVSFYRFGQGIGHYEKYRTETTKLDEKHLNRLFSAFTTFFSNKYFEIFPTDIGHWHMELMNSDGIGYRFSGALCANFEVNGINLSDLVRESLGMPGLYVFDGNLEDKERTCAKIRNTL